jgi:uncharacterized protein YydD (DUF2326 family)
VASKITKIDTMMSRVQDSFEKVMELLKERYGELKVVSMGRGEGSFGVAISVTTAKGDNTFIVKT